MAEGLKCPVCKTPLPDTGTECPTCGLPRELWPDTTPVPSKKAGLDDLFGDLMKDLEGLESESPLGGASAPSSSAPAAPPVSAGSPSPPKDATRELQEALRASAAATAPSTPSPPLAPSSPSKPSSPSVPSVAPPPVSAVPTRPLTLPSTKEREEDARAVELARRPKDLQPVEIAAQSGEEGLPLQAIMDEVSSMIQVGRRAAFDMTSFGPTAARAVGLVRAGASDEARQMLTSLRKRLYDYLSRGFSGRVEELEIRLRRTGTFLRTDQALVHLQRTRESLKVGDFPRAQIELRRLEGETKRLDEELGSLGDTLEQVDLLTGEVERMGGDTTPALLYQGKALDAARLGDRKKAEGLLTTSSAILLDTLAPLMGQELVRLTEQIKGQRAKGRDIRAAVGLIRQITVDLKTRNYTRAVAALARLREEIARGDEATAREASEVVPPLTSSSESVRGGVRTKVRSTASATSTAVDASTGTPVPTVASAPSTPSSTAPSSTAPSAPPATTSSTEAAPAARSVDVKPGHSYLIFESRAKKAAPIFLKLKGSRKGLFLTTTFPPRIMEATPLPEVEVVWLSDSTGWEDTINPRTLEHDLASRVHSFLRGEAAGALGLDGLGTLISENGIDKVEKFLKSILDTAAARSVGVVVTLAQGGLDARVQARLEALFDDWA
jgi:hypothetical protein